MVSIICGNIHFDKDKKNNLDPTDDKCEKFNSIKIYKNSNNYVTLSYAFIEKLEDRIGMVQVA